MLPLPLSQYLQIAQRLAKRVVGERIDTGHEHDELHDASPKNWRQTTRDFTSWFYQTIAKASEGVPSPIPLLDRLVPVRGDPSITGST